MQMQMKMKIEMKMRMNMRSDALIAFTTSLEELT
jgi:hypothetical protein